VWVSPDDELEALASATAVAESAGAKDAEDAARRARGGDAFAREAFDHAGRALGVVLAGLVNVLNPEAICIGGGMAGAFDLLEPPLLAELDARAFRLAREVVEVFPAALGGDAGVLGAAWLALHGGDDGA
jgi:glucokinase